MKKNKYLLDQTILISNIPWRIAGFSFRFGKEWQYTLQRETTEGTFKTIQMNEQTLEEIIKTQSQCEDPLFEDKMF